MKCENSILFTGGGGSIEEGGWSQPVNRSRQQYSVESSKLKNKPVSIVSKKSENLIYTYTYVFFLFLFFNFN